MSNALFMCLTIGNNYINYIISQRCVLYVTEVTVLIDIYLTLTDIYARYALYYVKS